MSPEMVANGSLANLPVRGDLVDRLIAANVVLLQPCSVRPLPDTEITKGRDDQVIPTPQAPSDLKDSKPFTG